jgi:diguanylate cyclase (GGDEF)-like protein
MDMSVTEPCNVRDAGAVPICLVDSRGRLIGADRAFLDWIGGGLLTGAPWGRPIDELFADEQIAAELRGALASGKSAVCRQAVVGPPGAKLPMTIRLELLEREDGPCAAILFSREAPRPAPPILDALTRLPDRRAVADRVASWRRAAAPAPPRFALLFLDLDGFKRINDDFGHAVGDRVLQTLAERWLECVRDDDLIVRYGGDEFVVLIRDAAAPQDIEPVIRRLQDATSAPFVFEGLDLSVAATIGWSAAVDGDRTIEELLAAADRNMYDRKRRANR